MDKVPKAKIRLLCGVMKGVDEKINEGVFQWMERDRITRRVYVG